MGANITRWLYVDDLLPKKGGEIKVGERITLEVVEKKGSCEGCFFYNSSSCSIMPKCTKFARSDKKYVIFKEVK